MKKNIIPEPHGGCGLVNRIVPEIERESFIERALRLKTYTISAPDVSIFYRIADGALSPLQGPMSKEEFYAVLEKEYIVRNNKKYAWTIPFAFAAAKADAEGFEIGETIAVQDEFGLIIGTMEISDIYKLDKDLYNQKVYMTKRLDHPGPRIINEDNRGYLLAGSIWALPQLNKTTFGKYMLSPEDTRRLFSERSWERIVAFQTRNALHRAHEYAMVYALEKLTKEGFFTGVVLNPLVGATKSDDVPAEVRMSTYEALLKSKLLGYGDSDDNFWKGKDYSFTDQIVLVGLDMKMYYAGPKEAIMHAIYRQNYGFTDIIIGRKHADAHFDNGDPAWGDFDAHDKFDKLSGELKIKPVKVGFAGYFEEIQKVGLIEDYKDKGYHQVSISGKELRKKLAKGQAIDERIMRRPVAQILIDYYKEKNRDKEIVSKNITWHESGISKQDRQTRNRQRGAVLWFTGLPSSGKSTIAVELQALLFEMGNNVYVLDGDNIRHGLNKDLGFSPLDRQENIRRIGEVARLFADAGFLVITAFIS
ncbi:MAG: adenylyl-sulfate kinase, partial [Candidatus Omnitrophica bacterium]|nr:adenylyl-sulfate kinase [Candidatus Omnitrophota bacterium]